MSATHQIPTNRIVSAAPSQVPWTSDLINDAWGLAIELRFNNACQVFRWISPGRFLMGSPTDEPERGVSELRHEVTLSSGFWLADTACTQAFWMAVWPVNPSHFQDDAQNPVENVAWHDAQRFIAELNRRRFDPDYARLVVLNTLFGGYFGSRLMSNIREDKGYTYGIYSSLTPGAFSGSMVIHTETGRDVIEQAVKEVYKEMDLLRKKEASAEELLLVKNYLLGGLLGDLDGPFSILHRWRTLILHGFGKEQFNNNIRIYKTVTAKELRTFAEKYYDPKAFCEVVVV